jgi:hypothetical protein
MLAVKAAFSPDDDFIVGGSADGAVYIWDASVSGGRAHSRSVFQSEEARAAERRLPLFALKGHASDVNGVAWSRQDFSRIASGSDDGTVRLWQANREDPDSQSQAASFTLRESATAGRGWENWKEFLEQTDGAAYAITAARERQQEEEGEQKSPETREETTPAPAALDASPMVIRRSEELQQRRGNRRRQRAQPPATEVRHDSSGGRSARRRISAASTAASSAAAPTPAIAAGTLQQTTLFDCWQQ